MGRRVLGPVVAALILGLVGCTGDQVPADTPTPDGPSPTPTSAPTEPPADPDELPGEAFPGHPADSRLAVVGVAASDVLNLRSGPGVDFDVIAELAPLEDDVIATGRSRLLGGMTSIWVEAEVDGVTGWANSRYLAYLGSVDDITSQLGTPAGGSELVDVADAVARQWAGDGADYITVTVVDGPHHGDLGEITVDVLGLGDDSVMGARLHIFASPDGGRFTARTVESTLLCARGVDDGLCI